ncbi:MAG: PD-(D/E)XK nuclease family protein [Acidobacteriaceae bacterium]|jgi:hypothetical protein
MPHLESAKDLLESVTPIVAEAQEKWKRTARGFNSFTLLDPKEIVQTRIIAGLLDPRGNHGQGEEFLKRFLKAIDEDHEIESLEFTRIDMEVMTRSLEADRRRIDLLITLPTGRQIAVESKARGAGDQRGQIEDYLRHLENVAPQDNLLLYLSRKGEKPANVDQETWDGWTKGAPPKVLARDYDDLMSKWLESCEGWLKPCEDFCDREATPLLTFLHEFRKFSSFADERSPLMIEETTDKIATLILTNRDHVIGCIAIQNSMAAVWEKLAKRFLDALERQLKNDPRNDGWDIKQPTNEQDLDWFYYYLSLESPDVKKLCVMLQILISVKQPWRATIQLGINGDVKDATRQEKLSAQHMLERLKKVLPRGGQRAKDGWPWRQDEFEHMSCEDFACLLSYPPPEVLQRLADLLIRALQAVQQPVDAFEKTS